MPRVRARTLHVRVCRGCGETFSTHGTRVYCSNECNLIYRLIRDLVRCPYCRGTDRSLIFVLTFTQEEKDELRNLREAFALEHRACLITGLEEIGRSLKCQCGPCREERGEDRESPRYIPAPRATKRSTGYKRHRESVLERDNWICQICEIPIDRNAGPYDDLYATLDHIDRLQDGGTDEPDNLRAAHRWCNIAREGHWPLNDDFTIAAQARARFG